MTLVPVWNDDVEFRATMRGVLGRTLLDTERCYVLWQLARMCYWGLPEGGAVEVGVYRGGSAWVIASAFPQRGVIAVDTFTGIPSADAHDIHHVGDFADTTFEEVRNYFKPKGNVLVIRGTFPGCFDGRPGTQAMLFAFAHVDVDTYQSTYEAIGWLWPRMVKDGIILCDDYGHASCPGARIAVDQFVAQSNAKRLYLPTGQCLLWKGA